MSDPSPLTVRSSSRRFADDQRSTECPHFLIEERQMVVIHAGVLTTISLSWDLPLHFVWHSPQLSLASKLGSGCWDNDKRVLPEDLPKSCWSSNTQCSGRGKDWSKCLPLMMLEMFDLGGRGAAECRTREHTR